MQPRSTLHLPAFVLAAGFALLIGFPSAGAAAQKDGSPPAHIAAPQDPWHGWSFLIGAWTGGASGTPGSALGSDTFSFDLDRNVILRRSHTAYPAQNGRPAFDHNDLTVISTEGSGHHVRAEYWDNEGHAIHYTAALTHDGKSAVFTSEILPHQPRFRLTYATTGPDAMVVTFEIAPPGHPDDFKSYVSGTVHRTK